MEPLLDLCEAKSQLWYAALLWGCGLIAVLVLRRSLRCAREWLVQCGPEPSNCLFSNTRVRLRL